MRIKSQFVSYTECSISSNQSTVGCSNKNRSNFFGVLPLNSKQR